MVRLELTYHNWSSKYWIWDLIAVGVMSFSAQCPPGVPIQLPCSPSTPRTSLTTPVLPPAKVVRQLQLRAASARGRRLSTEVLWTLKDEGQGGGLQQEESTTCICLHPGGTKRARVYSTFCRGSGHPLASVPCLGCSTSLG